MTRLSGRDLQNVLTHTRAYIHTHTHIYTHMCTHRDTDTQTHTCTCTHIHTDAHREWRNGRIFDII